MRIDRVPTGTNDRDGATGREVRAPYIADRSQGDFASTILIATVRIDNFGMIAALCGQAVAEAVAADVRTFVAERISATPDVMGKLVSHGANAFDLISCDVAKDGLSTSDDGRARIHRWLSECARTSFSTATGAVHVALSWACVDVDPSIGDDDIWRDQLAGVRAQLPRSVQLPGAAGPDQMLAARDMIAARALFAELNEADLQFAWRPVGSLDCDAVLYLRATPSALGRDGQVEDRTAGYRSLERLGLAAAFDQAIVAQAIEHLARSDSHAVCVAISASSFRPMASWDVILARLSGERALAQRLFVALDGAQCSAMVAEAVPFADQLRRLGCRVVLEGLGAGQVAIATLMALRPEVVTLDPLFVRLASTCAPDEQLFQRIAALAAALAPVVVIEGLDDEDRAVIASGADAHWGAGDFIGQSSWRGPTRTGRRAAQMSAFSAFRPPLTRRGEGLL